MFVCHSLQLKALSMVSIPGSYTDHALGGLNARPSLRSLSVTYV